MAGVAREDVGARGPACMGRAHPTNIVAAAPRCKAQRVAVVTRFEKTSRFLASLEMTGPCHPEPARGLLFMCRQANFKQSHYPCGEAIPPAAAGLPPLLPRRRGPTHRGSALR